MRSKTNSILVAMAVADTLTGTCPLPSHGTTTGNNKHLSHSTDGYTVLFQITTDSCSLRSLHGHSVLLQVTPNTCPLPAYLRFYTWTLIQRRSLVPDPVRVPFSWCSSYFSSIDFLPTVFHTASIWLTVCLAVQRYICVSRFQPTAASSVSRQTGVIFLIVAVYVACLLYTSPSPRDGLLSRMPSSA